MSTTPDLAFTPAGDLDDVETTDELDALLEQGLDPSDDVDPGTGDGDEDDHDDADDEVAEGAPRAAAGAAGRSKAAANRALIRRVANKAAELAQAPEARRETLGKLLGVDADLADLTFAVMTADRSALAPVADLNAIAEADPFSAGVVAAAQGRARMKAVWTLLQNLGAEIPASIPPSDAKAAMALAPAVHRLPGTVRGELAQVVALARKS